MWNTIDKLKTKIDGQGWCSRKYWSFTKLPHYFCSESLNMMSHSVHVSTPALISGSGAPAANIENLKGEKYWLPGGWHLVA